MPRAHSAPRHRVARRRSSAARALAAAAASIVVGSAIAIALSGTSYALWNDAAPVSSTSVTSATLSLSTSQQFDTTLWSNLIVGDSVRQPFTVTNTGTIPMNLSAVATAATGYEVRLARTACSAALTGTALTGTAATTQATTLSSLAAGASATVCLEVSVVPGATPASTAAIAVTVRGDQQ